MSYVLIILYGMTWAGPSAVTHAIYPSEESCYRALAAIKTNTTPLAEADSHIKDFVAHCEPERK